MLILALAILALTRAEIVQRMRAPVITRADGLVRVYADCDEDVRREFQLPVASFAADTVETLYRGSRRRPERFASPGIVVHVGNVRTNDARVSVKVSRGDATVTHIHLKNPATSDLAAFRAELVKAFARSVLGEELSEAAAATLYRRSDPEGRVADDRERLERWLAGERGPNWKPSDDEEMIAMMRKILQPGRASRRDVLVFASRLFLYPRTYDEKFAGKYDCLSFRDAVRIARIDLRVRFIALAKADELLIFGGGRGDKMSRAAAMYAAFLRALAAGEVGDGVLLRMLDAADAALSDVLESDVTAPRSH